MAIALARKNVSGLPGNHQLYDTYDWLEDSDDESHFFRARPSHTVRKAPSITSMLSSVPTELATRNGKRLASPNPYQPHGPHQKRPKTFHTSQDAESARAQDKTSISCVDIDLSPPSLPGGKTERSHEQRSTVLNEASNAVRQTTVAQPRPPHASLWPAAGHQSGNSTINTDKKPAHHHHQHASGTSQVQHQAPPSQQPVPNLKYEDISAVPRSGPRVVSGPFVIDDSDDDVAVGPEAVPRRSVSPTTVRAVKKHHNAAARQHPQQGSAQLAKQLADSRKRRQEATERKRDHYVWSTDRITPVDAIGENIDLDASLRLTPCEQPKTAQVNDLRSRHHKDPPPPPHKRSTVDLSHDHSKSKDPMWHPERLSKPPLATTAHGPATSSKASPHQAQLLDAKHKQDSTAPMASHTTERDKKKHDQSRRVGEAKTKTDMAKQQRPHGSTLAQPDRAKKRQEAAENTADDGKRKLDAQKVTDAEREAKARKEEDARRAAERAKWEEAKKAGERNREALRKRQAEVEKERSVLSDRAAALLRLSARRPPQPAKELRTNDPSENSKQRDEAVGKGTAFSRPDNKISIDGKINTTSTETAGEEMKPRNPQPESKQTLHPVSGRDTFETHEKIGATAQHNFTPTNDLRKHGKGMPEDDGGLVLENDDPPGLTNNEPAGLIVGLGDRTRQDSAGPSPNMPSLPLGPQSLSSAGGQALVAQANASKNRGNASVRSKANRSHDRQLGEILPEDAQLVLWRDSGTYFKNISEMYRRKYGAGRSGKDTLQKRYHQLREHLKNTTVDKHLLELLSTGSPQAAEQVNRAVHGRWPLEKAGHSEDQTGDRKPNDGGSGGRVRQRNTKGHFMPDADQEASTAVRSKAAKAARSSSVSFGSSTDGTLAGDDQQTTGTRPTTGGKTLSDAVCRNLLAKQEESGWEDEAYDEAARAREHSPITHEDLRQFVYWVERREIMQEDLDDGYHLNDDYVWQKCSRDFDDLEDANGKAGAESLCVPASMLGIVDLARDHEVKCTTMAHGCKTLRTVWEGAGEVEVRVVRQDNYCRKAALPRCKDRWVKSIIWEVRERRVCNYGAGEDGEAELFEEKKETDTTNVVGNTVYSSLEEANDEAIKHFVALTFTPQSGNLTQREYEVQSVRRELQRELGERDAAEAEEVCFDKDAESEDGKEKVVVWVAELKLKGPRNL